MISFLLEPQNLPFSVALSVMVAIALMEGIGLVLGVGISSLIESMLPEINFDGDFEGLEMPELNNTTGMTKFLGWLRIGQVPILITLIIFLTIFGLTGLILQSVVESMSGNLLPAAIAAIPVFLITLPTLRIAHAMIAKIIPKDESYAVSEESFIGRIATITHGTATSKRGAQARLRDEHGRDHYIMVKPDVEGETFPVGTSVLLVTRTGSFFNAIKNPNPNLIDPNP